MAREYFLFGVCLILAVCNGQGENVKWEAKIITSDIEMAGTNADVYIQVIGTEGKSPDTFVNTEDDDFEQNHEDRFVFSTSEIGTPTSLRVWHDNSGDNPGWHLERVELRRLDDTSTQTYIFNCDCWLAVDEGDRKLDRTLPLATMNWRAWVRTSDIDGAETSSKVWMVIYGNEGVTRQIPLNYEGSHFVRGGSDAFQLSTVDIGTPSKIRVVTQQGDPWHLNQIELENMDGAELYTFECDCWLAKAGHIADVIEVSKPTKTFDFVHPLKDIYPIH